MDAQGPSRPPIKNQTQRDDDAQSKINLLIAYFGSARQELISRISQRDNAVLLFLAAAAAIFGVAFGNVTRPAILFAISPLGLGAAVIYAQHNTLIGQLGYYCGVEITKQAEKILGNSPDSWETSKSLFGPDLTGETDRPHGLLGMPWFYVYRLLAILLLIPVPGIVGALIGFYSIPEPQPIRVWGSVVGIFTALWAALLLGNSMRHRKNMLNAVSKWRRENRSEETTPVNEPVTRG